MLKLQARGATRSTSVLLVAQARELMPQSITILALHASHDLPAAQRRLCACLSYRPEADHLRPRGAG
ncbi:uncharacterized protein BDR25DRAFT_361345 [Lindgomyces ingoldianus]|uniref:Uncharacterized protein n=1 Tax=Lindgomyces ingoldianus TaxID=673940 RepID=A0ACB6QD31_9PLEO|nr:uncharacterized protein BDR25DRAFT_361345 [Lindgomyces ingoldianus]KAF2464807.1 hypothetical protein BDR25DRAFT_361345 [Lindgomyces ingoldianus]